MKTPNPDHPIRNSLKHLALASAMGAAIAMMSGSAGAAPITWGAVSVFDDATDVNANGLAVTVAAGANWAGTVNGVTFTDQQPGTLSDFDAGGSFGAGVFMNATGNANFDSLVGASVWNETHVPTTTISLSGLTPGQAYRIQAFVVDDRGTNYTQSGTLGDLDMGTASPTISRGNAGTKTSGNTIYGDFTADADGVQEFTVNGNLQMITGYVLTTANLTLSTIVTVPENGSQYLVGSTIPATATVQHGTAPYTVEFFLDNGSGFVSQGTVSDAPYTKNVTVPTVGSYSIKATVTDFTSATGDSPVKTFSVSDTGPANLVAVPGNQFVNLSWNQVLGATGYKVFRSSPDNTSFSEIATGITGLTYQNTGLVNGTQYHYHVTATTATTESQPSVEASAVPITATPGAITWGPVSVFDDATDVNANGLAVVVSAGANWAGTVNGVTFTDEWPGGTLSNFDDAVDYPAGTFMNATGDAAFDALVGTLPYDSGNTTITLSGLTDGQAYRLQCFFVDDRSGYYTQSGTLGDLDGGTPSVSIARGNTGTLTSGNTIYGDFTADADGIQQFTVNGNLKMLTGYVLTTANLTLSTIVTVPENDAEYLVGSAIPATATVQHGTAPYTVEFFLDNGSGFVSQGTVSDAPYTKNVTVPTVGSYSIKATVTDFTSATDDSPVKTFSVSDTGPANLVAVPGNQLVNLSWNQVLGATGYKVFRSSPDNTSFSEIATGITGLTYQNTGLVNGTTYHYYVTATTDTTESQPSFEVSAVPITAPPVSDYVRWFDASTLGLADGDPVTTWPDGSTSLANATVPSGNATPVYVANAGTGSGLGAVSFARNSGPSNSAALRFTRHTGVRTVFSVFKGSSFLLTDNATYDFSRPSDVNPADPLWDATYANGSIRSGSTYVNGTLVDGTTFPMPTALNNGFNLVEVLTDGGAVNADSFNKDRTSHSGDQYHAEVIIYDRVLTESERLAVEAYLINKWFPNGFPASGFGTWADANGATGQNPQQDHDNDGVENGIEYFMGETGSSFTAMPGLDENNMISWPAEDGYQGTYEVQTSTDLVNWTNVSSPKPTPEGGILSYTLPPGAPGGKSFVRLLVTPTP